MRTLIYVQFATFDEAIFRLNADCFNIAWTNYKIFQSFSWQCFAMTVKGFSVSAPWRSLREKFKG